VSETTPRSDVNPIYDSMVSHKLGQSAERIVSPCGKEYDGQRRVLAWSVRWVLDVRRRGRRKRLRAEASVLATFTTGMGKTLLVYRRQILEVLRWPKPAFDQLALELPTLMGFRPEEVATWRAEYIDWLNSETLVLDAKKHKLFPVPLNTQAARHAEEVLGARRNGYVLRGRTKRKPGEEKPLTGTAIWYIWQKWAQQACTFLPEKISPIDGRRLFAYEFYHRQPENLVELQVIMRHTSPGITLLYVSRLVCWDDVKTAYDKFQLSLRQEAPLIHG